MTVAEHSGRLDQIMSNLNTLYHTDAIFYPNPVKHYILSGDMLTWLLRPGTHKIYIPDSIFKKGIPCGLIPLTRCVVTTSGLRWNLGNFHCFSMNLLLVCMYYQILCIVFPSIANIYCNCYTNITV